MTFTKSSIFLLRVTLNHKIKMSIGKRIKKARERKDLTLSELGKRIGVTHAAISNVEHDGNSSKSLLVSLGRELDDDFGLIWLRKHLSEYNSQKSFDNFEEIFETKIQEIVRREIRRGATIIRNVREGEIYEVLDDNFTATSQEIINDVKPRILEAINYGNERFDKDFLKSHSHIKNKLSKFYKGKKKLDAKEFLFLLSDINNHSKYNIGWILNGKGDKFSAPESDSDEESEEDKIISMVKEFVENYNSSIDKGEQIKDKVKLKSQIRDLLYEEILVLKRSQQIAIEEKIFVKFDVKSAIKENDDIKEILKKWYKFEGKELSSNFNIDFDYDKWNDLNLEVKVETLINLKIFTDAII